MGGSSFRTINVFSNDLKKGSTPYPAHTLKRDKMDKLIGKTIFSYELSENKEILTFHINGPYPIKWIANGD